MSEGLNFGKIISIYLINNKTPTFYLIKCKMYKEMSSDSFSRLMYSYELGSDIEYIICNNTLDQIVNTAIFWVFKDTSRFILHPTPSLYSSNDTLWKPILNQFWFKYTNTSNVYENEDKWMIEEKDMY